MLAEVEQGQLNWRVGLASWWRDLRIATRTQVIRFELREDVFCSFVDVARNSCEPCDVYAVTLIRAARNDAMEEDDVLVPFLNRDVEVPYFGQRLFELR